jgi:hypothetical protein
MERIVERGAGLDVHQATVAACVRVPGAGCRAWRRAGDTNLWHDHRATNAAARLAGRVWRH